MNAIKHIFILNWLILLKDKMTFVWSILFPIVLLFINGVSDAYMLVYWWVYILFTSFLYGVGIYALSEKDSGFLAIIFSIKWIPVQFFTGIVLVQMMYSFLCITLVNIVASVMYGFDLFSLVLMSSITVIMAMPIAFLSYNVTYLKRAYASSVNSMAGIVIFGLFMGLQVPEFFPYNPMAIVATAIIEVMTHHVPVVYLIGACVVIGASIPSILQFKPLSSERR